jgi:hypothetical protein
MIIGAFTEMDALALFMIGLQAANRKLHKIFDVSDGIFNEQRAHRMSNGLESAACLTHIKASWDVRKQEAREGHAKGRPKSHRSHPQVVQASGP